MVVTFTLCDDRVTKRDRSSQKRQLIIKIRTINILFTLFVRFLAFLVSFSHIYDVYIAKSKSSHQIYPFNTVPTLTEAFWAVIFTFWALFW